MVKKENKTSKKRLSSRNVDPPEQQQLKRNCLPLILGEKMTSEALKVLTGK
jgi:hypothetical protein